MKVFHTHISSKAIELAAEALKSSFISEGKLVRQFEDELASVFEVTRPVTVNSGTSALHLALSIAELSGAMKSSCLRKRSLLLASRS
jgi:perosamine synthetase